MIASIAGVARMIERLDLNSKHTGVSVPLSSSPGGTSNLSYKGKDTKECEITESLNEIVGKNVRGMNSVESPCVKSIIPSQSEASLVQVEALEKFYIEYIYPSEELKSQIAESVGLSERQVSGWFCHRRLKDKKQDGETAATGRQDRSSKWVYDLKKKEVPLLSSSASSTGGIGRR
ncbi:hypothetical protein RHGRI_004643 [Rhododendron griersonianum]|uniref:Homeobox domain-containing protein n=1 Tax=Rhododendron griersonianum TaxID=479676 RepID=A0AAV6L9P9_9ERIC|nr:hypothetical protein RHGRI_004643 [Rhododendron griersonianum]